MYLLHLFFAQLSLHSFTPIILWKLSFTGSSYTYCTTFTFQDTSVPGSKLNKLQRAVGDWLASIPGRLKDGLVHTVCACVNRPKNLGGRDILVFQPVYYNDVIAQNALKDSSFILYCDGYFLFCSCSRSLLCWKARSGLSCLYQMKD